MKAVSPRGSEGQPPEAWRVRDGDLRARLEGEGFVASALPARTHLYDPGYEPHAVGAHLQRHSKLMASLKIPVPGPCTSLEWLRDKVSSAKMWDVPVVSGLELFDNTASSAELEERLDQCASLGISRVEMDQDHEGPPVLPAELVRKAARRGLAVHLKVGVARRPHGPGVETLIDWGRAWLDAGTVLLIVRAGDGALRPGGGSDRSLDLEAADRFAGAFGLSAAVFEAPSKYIQFALLRHFGSEVGLSGVRIEELPRVEIFRRGGDGSGR